MSMARKKHQKKSVPTPTSTQHSTGRKRRRPSQQLVEVPSDEEDETAMIERKGAARGLNANNILPSRTTAESIEAEGSLPKAEAKHETRSTRNGKSKINYDMKVSA